jgi:hypothetical protein
VIYTVREMAKISIHLPAPSSVPDTLAAADTERRRKKIEFTPCFQENETRMLLLRNKLV